MFSFAGVVLAVAVAAASETRPYDGAGNVPGVSAQATGFFRVERIGKRWTVIDPLGHGFVPLGVDHVSYLGLHCEALGYAPYHEYNKRTCPDEEVWMDETAARLRDWGFNMLGNSEYTRKLKSRGFVYADPIGIGARLCRRDPDWGICCGVGPGAAFPNVFHPQFKDACEAWARERCTPQKDDPWLLGYFLDNELQWWGSWPPEEGLFNVVMSKPDTHPAKRALVAALAGREATKEVKRRFVRAVANRYFAITSAAIRKADPNHMVLGCRFAGLEGAADVVWEAAAEHCDIVSVNCYPWADLERGVILDKKDGVPIVDRLKDYHRLSGRPLMVTEWSFIGLDTGHPCTFGCGQRLKTQAERAAAAELFAKTLLSLDFVVGYDYFMWVDEPKLGLRKGFNEDCNYGLVNEEGKPYPELTDAFRRIQRNLEKWRK